MSTGPEEPTAAEPFPASEPLAEHAATTDPVTGAPVTDAPAADDSALAADDGASSASAGPAANMLPGRERRRFGVERFLMRLIATAGIVGIGVALGAILAASNVQGWIIGLAVAAVSVVLAAVLWSSQQV